MRILIGCILLFICSSNLAFSHEVYWADFKCEKVFGCRNPGKRYHAVPFKAQHFLFGNLANASRETAFEGTKVHFPKGTRFALYRKLPAKNDEAKVLALSESGVWAFLDKRKLRESDNIDERTDIKAAIKQTVPFESIRAGKIFGDKVRACSKSIKKTFSGKLNIKANAGLGILKSEISAELSTSYEVHYSKGYNFLISRFYRNSPERLIEIQAYEECGTVDLEQPDFRFDVFVNGKVKKLRPENYTEEGFPLDRGRPVIGCLQQYTSYANYLKDVHEIDDEWIPIVVAMTARWRFFESSQLCENYP